tara:strand:- start:2915 stop:3541 length:627 start_codon:yes stop_codon:yes gene_type:complete
MIKKRKGTDKNYLVMIDNFMNKNFRLSLEYIKEIRNYIYFSFALFLVFGMIGFVFPIFFSKQIMILIQELIKQTQGLGVVGLIRFIIANNMQSAFFGMTFGIALGIFPLIVTIINGYILGFVANQVVIAEGGGVLWKLLPHGIFEIPAIMIAVAVGLKLGLFLFISKKRTLKEFGEWIVKSIRVFLLIVIPLLVIAGIIESLLIAFLE